MTFVQVTPPSSERRDSPPLTDAESPPLGPTTSSFGPAPIVPTSSKVLPPSRLRLTLPSLPALNSASEAPQAMRAPKVVSRWRQVLPSLLEIQVPWSVETAQTEGLPGSA